MRRGRTDKSVITTEITETSDKQKSGGQVIGINLGWDFVAEHEWGINAINGEFGVPGKPERRRGLRSLVQDDLIGAEVRTVTTVPSGLKFYANLNGYTYLLFDDYFNWAKEEELTAERLNEMLKVYDDEELATAWCDNAFGIRIKNDILYTGTMVLEQIYKALVTKDAMIFLGGINNEKSNSFGNRGLVIAIRSQMPEAFLNRIKKADDDYLNLREAVTKTGIEEKLRISNKGYYALSPRWASEFKNIRDITTKHPVIFWLNPIEQQDNNYGWFSVEQLTDWIDGKGPIPKTTQTRDKHSKSKIL
ncbi:MAG: hypothetical protein AAB784_02110 [Patescibacteria group bacterium]